MAQYFCEDIMFKIEVFKKSNIQDSEGKKYLSAVTDLKIKAEAIQYHKLYIIEGNLSLKQAELIAEKILVDPIIENYKIDSNPISTSETYQLEELGDWKVYKTFHYGVTDNIGERTLKAIHDIKLTNVNSVSTGSIFYIYKNLPFNQIKLISNRIFANPIIESYSIQKIKG